MKSRRKELRELNKHLIILVFLVFALGFVVWFLTRSGIALNLGSKAAGSPTKITIRPTRIGSNDGYNVNVTLNGSPYDGLLDYDLTRCDLKFSSCVNRQDVWGNYRSVNGVVSIPTNLNLPEGYYLVRFKPRGYPASYFSNFDLQVVSNRPTLNTFSTLTTTIPMPPRGSYSIMENRNGSGVLLGYTRIDVETDTDPTLCGGDVWRYTKTTAESYWNPWPPEYSDLRWCVKQVNSAEGLIVRAISGKVYRFNGEDELNNIKVQYLNSLNGQRNQALLGGFGIRADKVSPWEATADSDMPYHYMLYPLNRKLPSNLSSTPIIMVNEAVGHPLEGMETSADIWHVEMLAPRAPNSLITFRQVENGFSNRFTTKKWIITEDWTFNSRGLFTMIQQWWDTPARCWSPSYQCESGNNKINAKMIESYIPNNQPLTLTLSGNNQTGSRIRIPNGGTYELQVKKADGTNYSGFLEIGSGQTSRGIWRDISRRPIYVSAGRVLVTPEAYGNRKDFVEIYTVRPYLTNSSINSLIPTADWGTTGIIPNASTATYSNQVTQIVGNP